MKTYLLLQLKRVAKLFPYVLVVALILFGALLTVFHAVLQKLADDDAQNALRVRVAVTGDTNYPYFDLWMSAVRNFDTSQYAIDIVKMEEDQAESALEAGSLAAYVVLPDNFIEEALCGRIKTITYVTTSGAVDTMSLFKDEVTEVISSILAESQKGVYGIANALDNTGHEDVSYEKLNELNLKYIDLILDRSELYHVEPVAAEGDDVPLQIYLFSGITVLFVFLTALPYALLYIKKDRSLHRTLAARGFSPLRQLLCEYAAYAIAVQCLFVLVLAVLSQVNADSLYGIPGGLRLLRFAVELFPVILTVAACGFLVFELSEDLVSGLLCYFFLTLALCYVSGCLYPLYAFPETVQRAAVYLPTALAREYVTACLTGNTVSASLPGVLLYAVLFVAAAVGVRRGRLNRREGGAV